MQEKWYISHYRQNRLNHYIMDPRATWIKVLYTESDSPQIPQSGHKSVSRRSNFVSVSPNLHPWWDFYLETRGRYLRRIWTDPAITTSSLGATTINLLEFPCLHTGQHNRRESFTVLPHFFCPLPTHFEVYSALSGLPVTGVSHGRCEAKPIPIIFPWL